MSVRKGPFIAGWVVAPGLLASLANAAITIPTAPIGNPGNAPDSLNFGTRLRGAVSYSYRIATTEVTNVQYAAFLNAVAQSDPHGLYNFSMGADALGGILRFGTPGSYSYSVKDGRGNHPVAFVGLTDAVRFANWLHNGQPTGPSGPSTTEDGAYTMTPFTIYPVRNAGWSWAIPNIDEWHKAAYFQPATEGGDIDNYWRFPTSANTIDTSQANYGVPTGGDTRPVGSYAPNANGVFDMGGNIDELTETIGFGGVFAGAIAVGGAFNWSADGLSAEFSGYLALNEGPGFRVVQVPGPTTGLVLGVMGILASRRRRNIGHA